MISRVTKTNINILFVYIYFLIYVAVLYFVGYLKLFSLCIRSSCKNICQCCTGCRFI